MMLNWNFLGGEGAAKQKNLPWGGGGGEYGYLLEVHIGRISSTPPPKITTGKRIRNTMITPLGEVEGEERS